MQNLWEPRGDHVQISATEDLTFIGGGANTNGLKLNNQTIQSNGQAQNIGDIEIGRLASAVKIFRQRIVIMGGTDYFETTAYDQVIFYKYDPFDSGFTEDYAKMPTARYGHKAIYLDAGNGVLNGKILVMGGTDSAGVQLAGSELYDIDTDTWSNTGEMSEPRTEFTATFMTDGRIAVVGGGNVDLSTVDIYSPLSNTWTTGPNLNTGRRWHTAAIMQDGCIMVIGGYDENYNELNSTEIFDLNAGAWLEGPPMAVARARHACEVLPDGRIMVAGGFENISGLTKTTELFGNTLVQKTVEIKTSKKPKISIYNSQSGQYLFFSSSLMQKVPITAIVYNSIGKKLISKELPYKSIFELEKTKLPAGVFTLVIVKAGVHHASTQFAVY